MREFIGQTFSGIIGSIIAITGVFLSIFETPFSNMAMVIGSMGWLMVLFGFPVVWEDRYHLRARADIAEFAYDHGYCPQGRKGDFKIEDIHSRCCGAGRAKCTECIEMTMGDKPSKYRKR